MGNRQGEDDPRFVYFLIWVALTRQMRFKLILSENVPGQGKAIFTTLLGDLYLVEHFICDPTQFGWCTSRPRQFIVLIERNFANMKLKIGPVPPFPSDKKMLDAFALQQLLQLLKRPCGFTYKSYMIADEAEINRDLIWAAGRPGVKDRHSGTMSDEQARKMQICAVDDAPGSFLDRLTVNERLRLPKYRALAGNGKCYDLNQDPVHCLCTDLNLSGA